MSEPAKIYLTRAGKRGEDEEFALEHGLAVIGFQEVPSLEGAADYDAVLEIVHDSLPGKKPKAIGNIAGQLWAFAVAMIVLAGACYSSACASSALRAGAVPARRHC